MKYDVELSDQAADVLAAQPVEVARDIEQHLQTLASAPLAYGRRAHFPYRPVGLLYDFWCDVLPPRRFVTAFFHFAPGEKAIKVYAITVRAYPSSEDGEES